MQQARIAGGFDDIFFGTPKGEMYRSHPERNRADYDPRTRVWYQDAQAANKQIITEAYRDAITNALLVTIAEPVKQHGELLGVVGADVLIDQLVKDVISLNVGHNATAMLIDMTNGTFLAHPNSGLLLKPVSAFSPSLNLQTIQQKAMGSSMLELAVNGTDKLMFFSNVPGTNWVFAIELDKATELAGHKTALTQLVITSLVIVLLVGIVASWLMSFFSLMTLHECLKR